METTDRPIYEFTCELTEEDYFEYNLYHCFSVPETRKRNQLIKYLSAAVFFACSVVAGLIIEDWGYFIITLIAAVSTLAFYRAGLVISIRRNIAHMKKMGKLPFDAKATLRFYDQEIVSQSAEATLTTNYSVFKRVIVGPHALYLFSNAIAAFILPNSAFKEIDRQTFLQWFVQKTNATIIAGRTR